MAVRASGYSYARTRKPHEAKGYISREEHSLLSLLSLVSVKHSKCLPNLLLVPTF